MRVHRSHSSVISNTAIMGIKGFRAWFESQFPRAMRDLEKETSHETFDHVLIDMNQLLHIALRRAVSEGHALAMLMKELDACVELATPTTSLVLAVDGPPSAAKLATQRRRRFGTWNKSEWKQRQLARFTKTLSKRQELAFRRRYATEVKTLCITPGTDFMALAEQCLLYWAWQRLQNPRHILANVKIYISSSNVPGEGEIKLIDWILQTNRNGESIALMGGDSDLVLEGLVIPPTTTHNVFVLLPDGSHRYLAVSLWETTRALAQLLPGLKSRDIMRIRTDLVLLLILNGNDYLPKLRGSAGFNKIFHTYLKLVQTWLGDPTKYTTPFLIDPDSLNFNLPFCIEFFQRLIPNGQSIHDADTIRKNGQQTMTALGHLNNLVDTAFMPKPMRWSLTDQDIQSFLDKEELEGDDDDDHGDSDGDDVTDEQDDNMNGLDDNDNNNSEAEEADHDKIVLLRLTLGKPNTDEYYVYEIKHNTRRKLKYTKNLLAGLALDDLMGTEYANELARDEEVNGLSNSGYSWEIQHPLDGLVDTYLQGIIWNLQTYQDGVCVDYGYNYGKRMSPLSSDIVAYFQLAQNEGREVGRTSLLPDAFETSVSSGVSCLAALPSQIQELIPEPYRMLSNTTVEDMYASCMDPVDNTFYLKKFERIINKEVKRLGFDVKTAQHLNNHAVPINQGRRVICSDHAWTVLSRSNTILNHPFEPPAPFSSRFSPLKPNHYIRVGRVLACTGPRSRNVWPRTRPDKGTHKSSFITKHDNPPEWTHGDIGNLLATSSDGERSIFDVQFKTGYQRSGAPTWNDEKLQRTPAMISLGFKSAPELKNGVEKNSRIHMKVGEPTAIRKKESEQVDFPPIIDSSPFKHPGSKVDSKLANGQTKQPRQKKVIVEAKTTYAKENEANHVATLVTHIQHTEPLQNPDDKPFSKLKKTKVTKPEQCQNATEMNNNDEIDAQVLDIPKRMLQFQMTVPSPDPVRNPEDHTASMLLNQLEHAKMVKIKWDSIIPSPTQFASFNPARHECIRLCVQAGKTPLSISLGKKGRHYEQDREAHNQSKQLLKLHIASMALQDLLGPGNDWSKMTFAEMQEALLSRDRQNKTA